MNKLETKITDNFTAEHALATIEGLANKLSYLIETNNFTPSELPLIQKAYTKGNNAAASIKEFISTLKQSN